METVPRLVFGLGNPGREYAGNRHNIGRMAATGLARELGVTFQLLNSYAEYSSARIGDHDFAIAVATDYMNRSGFAVAALCRHFKVKPEELIVIHDDLDLGRAQLRIKKGGGSGGHNGLNSIIEVLGSSDFLRLRMGIGRPPGKMDPAEFVLSDFNAIEWSEMEFCFRDALEALKMIFLEGLEAAMNRFNRRPDSNNTGSSGDEPPAG